MTKSSVIQPLKMKDEGSEDDGELGEFEDGGDGENAQNDGQMTTRNRQS